MSPTAAAATLTNRARGLASTTEEELDEMGRAAAGDTDDADEPDDAPAGAEVDDSPTPSDRKRLRALAARATALQGAGDTKLATLVKLLKEMLKRGRNPIVFCRYIPTAEYVAAALREALGGKQRPEIDCITGTLPPPEREERVEKLAQHDRRLLVATDCLSEGINLQESFDAVVHYDLAWNPTRHEQREGRVDRYGQKQPTIPVPGIFASPCPWSKGQTVAEWLLPRVLELTHTSWDLESFARDCGYTGAPYGWGEERRFQLRCELDAAFFRLYLGSDEDWARDTPPALCEKLPKPRHAIEHIMDSFPIVKRKDEEAFGGYRPREMALATYGNFK